MTETDDLVARGVAASRAGDGHAAIRLFEAATRQAPATAMAHFLLASECAALGRVDAAEAAFAAAVLHDPAMAIARYQLGLLQFSTGRVTTARLTWDPLRAIGEDHPLSHFVRGFAALAEERFDAAVSCFAAGMALNRDNPPLNDDVCRVIEQVQACGDPPSPGSGDRANAGGSAAASHVLLGRYGESDGPP